MAPGTMTCSRAPMINMRCFPQQFRCYRHPLLRMHIRHGSPDANVKEITEAACFFRRSIREGPLLAHCGLEWPDQPDPNIRFPPHEGYSAPKCCAIPPRLTLNEASEATRALGMSAFGA